MAQELVEVENMTVEYHSLTFWPEVVPCFKSSLEFWTTCVNREATECLQPKGPPARVAKTTLLMTSEVQ